MKVRVAMSTHLFLDKEKIEIHGAFKKEAFRDGSGHKMSYGLHQIFADNGRLRTSGDINAPIPVAIAEFVTVCTHHEFFPMLGKRESGVYRDKSASLELFPAQQGVGSGPHYVLRITGTKTEDMKELRDKVIGGLVHPEVSYENPTLGLTRQQLLKKVDEIEGELEMTKDSLASVGRTSQKYLDMVVRFVEVRKALEKVRLPWINRFKIVQDLLRAEFPPPQ